MEELKTLAKGYFWESLFYGLSKIVSFVYSVIIAYLFLKDEIGLFYFSLSVIYVVSALKDFGLGASLYRNIPYLLGKKGFIDILKIIRISFSIGIMLSLIIFFIFYNFSSLVAIMINNPSSAEIIKFVAFLIILFEVFELTKYSILGFLDFKKGAFLDFFQSLMKLIGTVFFYSLYGNSIFVLVYGFIFSYIPSSLLGLFFLFSKTEFVKQQALQLNQIQSQIKFYELFAYGFTLTIVNSLFVIQQSVDKIMLAYFIQDAFSLIGIYTIVQTLSSAVVLLPYLIAIVSLPIMSSMYGANRNEELKDYIQNSFGILLIILLPAISFLLVFSETLIQLFYGRSFLLGNDAFVILIIANSIYASTSIFSQYLISTRKLLDELKFASINVFSNVIANAVLIPSYGIVGAALGTLLSSITMFVAIYIFISKQLNFTIEKRFVKMGIAAIISIIILIVVKDLLFDFIYVIMDSITNTYIPNESALIKIFLTRMIKLFILGLFFIISYLVFLFVGLLFKIYN
ncbi:MAG: polysaccharide biosynthesis C-terminal domain-containing protein, partial [Candidatus Anstonellales archaeon]